MSLKVKGLAALAVAGAAIAAAAAVAGPSAQAETVHCGIRCVTLASESFGADHVVGVSDNGGALLAPGYNSAEDFIAVPVGTVAELAAAGKIPSQLASAYAQEIVYEFSYAPYGALTGQCLGVASPTAGSAVVLQKCGNPITQQPWPAWTAQEGALWIGVYRDSNGDAEPFVNVAASTSAAEVLTASTASGPLSIQYMSLNSGYGASGVASDQMWESLIGIYGETTAWPTPQGAEPVITGR
jgi:hypothetical protein